MSAWREQLRELKDCVGEAVDELASGLSRAMQDALGPEVAAQQDGFARFCRETLGLEAATLLTAMGVPQTEDEAVDADPAKVAECAAWWDERWRRRFPAATAV